MAKILREEYMIVGRTQCGRLWCQDAALADVLAERVGAFQDHTYCRDCCSTIGEEAPWRVRVSSCLLLETTDHCMLRE